MLPAAVMPGGAKRRVAKTHQRIRRHLVHAELETGAHVVQERPRERVLVLPLHVDDQVDVHAREPAQCVLDRRTAGRRVMRPAELAEHPVVERLGPDADRRNSHGGQAVQPLQCSNWDVVRVAGVSEDEAGFPVTGFASRW